MAGISAWLPNCGEDSFVAQLSNLRDNVIDHIWPRLTGEPEKQAELVESIFRMDAGLGEEVKKILLVRVAQTQTRSETVDRKLLSLFRTTSLLATVAIAIFAGAANLPAINDGTVKPLVYLSIATILYGFAQLICATKATLQGLRASGYERLGRESLIPTASDTNETYNKKQIYDLMYIVEQNDWTTNQKVSCMELAYTALRNASYSLIVLMLLAFLLAVNIL